jgi:squalene-hopene/tetraprenyl-beta-curcumene cyclase
MTTSGGRGAEAGPVREEPLREAITEAQRWLLEQQHRDGYWWGELESNVSITAEYLLLTHHLGVGDAEQWAGISAYIRRHQAPDGSWPQYHDGLGNLSTSIEAYFALKLAGEDPNAPHMARARAWILEHGGIAKARVFTKLWLALFDQYDWEQLPAMPAWVNLLPSWFPVNLYEFASWARATIVGITVIFTLRPVATLPAGAGVQDLWRDPAERSQFAVERPRRLASWSGLFYGLDKLLRLLDRNHVRPFQRRALATAERWLLERQEADGAWAGIQPPWVYAILALRALGYPLDHPVLRKALAGFERFTWREDGMVWTESCQSPVWDTGLAAIALLDSELPADHPALLRAGEWMLQEQVFAGGDWQVKNPDTPPGGWAFEFDNDVYPDIDDTAVVMIALDGLQLPDEAAKRRAIEAGSRWMLSMQSKNGGWGAFDVDNTKSFLTAIPFADFGELLDRPTADVTAHALEFLGRMGYRGEYPPAARALQFLYDLQEPDGPWWGRWGVNYIYGLGAVLPALAELGEPMNQPAVRKAVAWLREHQRPDGGWGESADSYADPALRGAGPSTPSQTAWALLALLAAGEAASAEAARGVRYLVERQRPDGTWDEPEFTGTGFPSDFMINYHLYRHYFPLMALGRYAHALRAR